MKSTSLPKNSPAGDATYSAIYLTKALHRHFPSPIQKNKSPLTPVILFSGRLVGKGRGPTNE